MQSHAINAPVVGYGVDMVVMGMSVDSSTSSHKACLMTGYLYIAQASGVTIEDLKWTHQTTVIAKTIQQAKCMH